jgi:hypothetical protein
VLDVMEGDVRGPSTGSNGIRYDNAATILLH